jgi:gas vesicle protein
MSDNNDFVSFFAGLLVGGLVGAAVALLIAPQSGEETRTMIYDKGIELKDKAGEVSADVQERADKALADAKSRFDVAIEELRARTAELSKLIQKEQTEEAHTDAPAA